MKAIVGVDLAGSFRKTADLVCRLDIPNTQLEFINVVEPMPSTGWFAPTGYVPPAWETELRNAGEVTVENAIGQYCAQKISADGHVAFGSPADVLMDEAAKQKADLIAIGSTHKARWESALLGSVGRALTIASKHPILLARKLSRATGPMTAVLATDHSPYADRCIDRFLSWNPKGFGKIHLVTAAQIEPWALDVLKATVPQIDDPAAWVENELGARSEVVAQKIQKAGYSVYTHVLKGHPNDVLRHAMSAFSGDVLICGGQGHGFVERLVVGSVALHQAVAEHYSLLIVRPE